jgi:hypothetical protein
MIRRFLGNAGKSLICHGFDVDPEKLWITLLKTTLGACGRLVFQAFRWIAHQLSKFQTVNKNKDLRDVGPCVSDTSFYKQGQRLHLAFCA